MSKQLISSILVAVLTAAIAAGCGSGSSGGDESSATQPPTVTTSSIGKAAFVKRASQICTEGTERVTGPVVKALQNEGKASGKDSVEKGEAAFLRMINQVIGEIAELGAPAGEQAHVEAFLGSMQQAYNAAAESSTPSMQRLTQLFEKPGKLASADGLEGCVFS